MGCRRRFPIASGRLVRIVAGQDGSLAIGRRLPGRGAWLCGGDPDCRHRALRLKVLSRALRAELHPDAAAALRPGFPAPAPDARD